MAGTRRPDGADEREAFFVGVCLGLIVGLVFGALAVSW